MKAKELIEFITRNITVGERTCDTVKSGDTQKEIRKVAVTMLPTAKMLTEAIEWGADMIIEHEPIYFNHMDEHIDSPVTLKKEELVKRSGAVLFRFHDYPHTHRPDMIDAGFISALGIDVKETEKVRGGHLFVSSAPMTAKEFALLVEEKLKIAHVRICGSTDTPCTKFAFCLGASGDIFETVVRDDVECVAVGEVCEWRVAEYVRDAAFFGMNKSLLILGHVGSERDGMELMCKELKSLFPSIEFKYFDNEEVYTYTDKL